MLSLAQTDVLLFVVVATLALLLLTTFCLWFLIAYQRRHFRYQQELSRLREDYNRALLETELEIKEQTLRSISQELHDNVGQVLSLAKLLLSSLDLPPNSEMADKTEQVLGLLSRGMGDLRDLSRTMDANALANQGLVQAIQREADLISKTGRYSIDFAVAGTEHRLDAPVELILYRITQELINNIIRHANASVIRVHLQYTTGLLSLTIQDNGAGFDPTGLPQHPATGGAGLRNIRSRASLIGADVSIDSAPSRGTLVGLRLPFVTPEPTLPL